MAEPDQTPVETALDGRYTRFRSVLGKGAYKTVYRAFDSDEALEVAWNKLHVERLQKHELEKVSNEVKLLERIHHKNIIRFHCLLPSHERNGVKTIDFITEQMTSGTLKDYLKRAKAIKLKVIRRWSFNILGAIAYLHAQDPPIMHRDLKCDNIFINGHVGEVKIGDLGLSGVKIRDKADSVIGTPEFMAPELYESSYTEKVDVYAFGMCLLEMVTMEYPYSECSSFAQIFKKVYHGEKPKVLNRIMPGPFKNVINACLQREDKRPSAGQLLEDPLFKDWDKDSGTENNLSLLIRSDGENGVAGGNTRGHQLGHSGGEIEWSDPLDRTLVVSIADDAGNGTGQASASTSRPEAGEVSVFASQTNDTGGFKVGLTIPIENQIKRVEFDFDPFQDTSRHLAQELVDVFHLPPAQMVLIENAIENQIKVAKDQRAATSRNATPQPMSKTSGVADGGAATARPQQIPPSRSNETPVVIEPQTHGQSRADVNIVSAPSTVAQPITDAIRDVPVQPVPEAVLSQNDSVSQESVYQQPRTPQVPEHTSGQYQKIVVDATREVVDTSFYSGQAQDSTSRTPPLAVPEPYPVSQNVPVQQAPSGLPVSQQIPAHVTPQASSVQVTQHAPVPRTSTPVSIATPAQVTQKQAPIPAPQQSAATQQIPSVPISQRTSLEPVPVIQDSNANGTEQLSVIQSVPVQQTTSTAPAVQQAAVHIPTAPVGPQGVQHHGVAQASVPVSLTPPSETPQTSAALSMTHAASTVQQVPAAAVAQHRSLEQPVDPRELALPISQIAVTEPVAAVHGAVIPQTPSAIPQAQNILQTPSGLPVSQSIPVSASVITAAESVPVVHSIAVQQNHSSRPVIQQVGAPVVPPTPYASVPHTSITAPQRTTVEQPQVVHAQQAHQAHTSAMHQVPQQSPISQPPITTVPAAQQTAIPPVVSQQSSVQSPAMPLARQEAPNRQMTRSPAVVSQPPTATHIPTSVVQPVVTSQASLPLAPSPPSVAHSTTYTSIESIPENSELGSRHGSEQAIRYVDIPTEPTYTSDVAMSHPLEPEKQRSATVVHSRPPAIPSSLSTTQTSAVASTPPTAIPHSASEQVLRTIETPNPELTSPHRSISAPAGSISVDESVNYLRFQPDGNHAFTAADQAILAELAHPEGGGINSHASSLSEPLRTVPHPTPNSNVASDSRPPSIVVVGGERRSSISEKIGQGRQSATANVSVQSLPEYARNEHIAVPRSTSLMANVSDASKKQLGGSGTFRNSVNDAPSLAPPMGIGRRSSSWRSTQSETSFTDVGIRASPSDTTLGSTYDQKWLAACLELMGHCARGQYQAVLQKLDQGYPSSFADYDRRTPLHLASSRGHVDVVTLLIERGASVKAVDRWGRSPLSDAVSNHHEDVANVLKANGAEEDLDVKSSAFGSIMLQSAAKGDLEEVRRRLVAGADANYADYDARTALHLACTEGHVDIAELLLVNEANWKAMDNFGRTPVDDAVRNGHKEILRVLRQYGAEIPRHLLGAHTDSQHQMGLDMVENAAKGRINAVRKCIRNGAHPNFHDYDKRTALHLASVEGHVDIVELLLQSGADLNALDRWGRTARDEALNHNHTAVIDELDNFKRRTRKKNIAAAGKAAGAPIANGRRNEQVVDDEVAGVSGLET